MIKILCRILMVVFFIVWPFVVLASAGIFTYKSSGRIPSVSVVGDQYSIIYTITSHVGISRPISVVLKSSTGDFSLANNCKRALSSGESCTLKVQFTPSHPGSQSASLIVRDEEFSIIKASFASTSYTAGHLVFEQRGKSLSGLALSSNAAGIVTLKNTGGTAVTGLKLSNLTQAGFTNIDCPTATAGRLPAGAGCAFSYQIAARPTENSFTIVASGQGADNTPVSLPVTVVTAHLVGKVSQQLPASLPEGQAASFVMTYSNDDKGEATDVSVVLPQADGLVINSNNCGIPDKPIKLAPNATCKVTGTYNPPLETTGPQILTATLLYDQGDPIVLSLHTVLTPDSPITDVNIDANHSYHSSDLQNKLTDKTKRAGFVVLSSLQVSTVEGAPSTLVWVGSWDEDKNFSIMLKQQKNFKLYKVNFKGSQYPYGFSDSSYGMNDASHPGNQAIFGLKTNPTSNSNIPPGVYTGQLIVTLENWDPTSPAYDLRLHIIYTKH